MSEESELLQDVFKGKIEVEFYDGQIVSEFSYSLANESFTTITTTPIENIIQQAIEAGYADKILKQIEEASQ